MIKQISRKEAEELFGKPYDYADYYIESRTSILDFNGNIIGYITIHNMENINE